MMSLKEYNATIETQYLLQSKNNRERLTYYSLLNADIIINLK